MSTIAQKQPPLNHYPRSHELGIPSTEHAPTPKPKAVGYLRVSTDEQAANEKVSLDIQEADVRVYCERRGYELTHIYRDPGFSGESRNRPSFRQMCRDAEAEKFDLIVCWRGDRICRGFRPYVALQDALEGTDIEIEASNDVVNRRWLAMKAMMAGEELDAIKERARMGARGRAEKGQVKGWVKFGYRADAEGKPTTVEEQAVVVRRIFELYNSGLGCRSVAGKLNAEGIPAPRGKYWYEPMIWSILSNPCYTGAGHWGKRKHFKKDNGEGKDITHVRFMPQEQWLTIPYPPIVSEEVFREAVRRRHNQTRQRIGKKAELEWLLKGKLWCAKHNHLYTTHYSSSGSWLKRYYTCNLGTRFKDRCGVCPQPHPRADELEFRVTKWVLKFLLEPDRLDKLKEDYMKRLREGGGLGVIERAKQDLEKLKAERGRVLLQNQKGYLDDAELDLKMKNIRDQQELRREELERAEASYGWLADQIAALEALGAQTQRQAAWRELTQQGKDNLVKTVLKQVNITDRPYPDDIECVVNLSNLATIYSSPP